MALAEDEMKALMLAALEGDAGAYRRLLGALKARLHIYYWRRMGRDPAEAEDLVQEALIAIHTRRATFDRAQPLTAWVYAIARYKLIDHYRRTGRRIHVPLDDAGELAEPDHGDAADAKADVERGLAALPERARDLVRSVKLNDDSIAEVAARTGLSQSAVKVAVHRGYMKMTAHLRGAGKADRP